MAKLWKLTDENDQTYGGCQWGENVTVETSGEGELCGDGFTHWYLHPLLAVFFNHIHGCYDLSKAHLWEGEGEVCERDGAMKVGCVKATTACRMPLACVTVAQRIRFGILCAQSLPQKDEWEGWANRWLSGEDRSSESAYACYLASRRTLSSRADEVARDAASAATALTNDYYDCVWAGRWSAWAAEGVEEFSLHSLVALAEQAVAEEKETE